MKIVQIVPYLYPALSYGGPAKFVFDLSIELSKHHPVLIITTDSFDKYKRIKEKKKFCKNLTIIYSPNLSNYLAYRFKLFIPLILYLKAPFFVFNNDVFHFHDTFIFHHLWLALWCVIFRKPYVITPHGTLDTTVLKKKSIFKKVLLTYIKRVYFDHAVNIIALTNKEKNDLESFAEKSKIIIVNNGIDLSVDTIKEPKAECRKLLNLPEDKTIITYIGRINWKKGLNLLVDAMSKVKNDSYHFVIAGPDDGFESALNKSVTTRKISNLTRLGFVDGKLKEQLFKSSDIFIYPSYSEGFSITILEALSRALPVIITKSCNFNTVQEKKAGLVIRESADEIIKAIQILKDKSVRDSFSKNAFLLVQNYSIIKTTQKHIDIYQKK